MRPFCLNRAVRSHRLDFSDQHVGLNMNVQSFFSSCILLCFLAGCQTQHNFSHVQISNFESPQIKVDPGKSLSSYSTFAVVPNDAEEDTLMQKQILFLAASALEGRGYEHVDLDSGPDLLLTVGFSNEYESSYVPPSAYTIPVYNPGQTYTTNTNAYVYSPYGSLYGTAQTYTTTPGYWSAQTYTSPGYTVGWYFPTVSVSLWDTNSNDQIWSGSNVGSSQMQNLGITAPFVLASIVDRIPLNTKSSVINGLLTESIGTLNFYAWRLSREGSAYYPTVTGVPNGSSAKKAGLKVWDMVIEMSGRSTANIRGKDLIDLAIGPIGETVLIKVFRMGKVFDAELQVERLSEKARRYILSH